MSNILIAGDSWGIGIFAGEGENYGPTGQGIQTMLEAEGHTVTNISKAGGSNGLMLDRLNNRWEDTGRCLFGVDPNSKIDIDYSNIDYIVFLQTDIFRERHYYGKQGPTDTTTQWKVLEKAFVDQLLEYESIEKIFDSYFVKFYTELNEIGQKYNKKILMLGGWNQLHLSVSNYSNLIPVVNSATKLLIPELEHDVYLSDHEWYTQLADNQTFMQKFGTEFKPLAIYNSVKIDLICQYWGDVHPDIQGYQKLTDHLLAKISLE
jgi:hypothetical protein